MQKFLSHVLQVNTYHFNIALILQFQSSSVLEGISRSILNDFPIVYCRFEPFGIGFSVVSDDSHDERI